MTEAELHRDPAADHLWRQCRHNQDLRSLFEGILASGKPELGRILLLSPSEVFGEVQARVGRKLSLLFRLTGFPYLSGNLREVSKSLKRMATRRGGQPGQFKSAKKAIKEWAEANGRQAQNLAVAAALETVRRNPCMQALVAADKPVTPAVVAQTIPQWEALDWRPMEELIQLFEPFLARSASKKAINRLTLNFTALLGYFQPEMSQQDLVIRSAHHFVDLLRKRGVDENIWRELLFWLIDHKFVAPYTNMFLWCQKVPRDGFVAALLLALVNLPPYCPACGRDAHAMASFAPHGLLREAMCLKDGLLGAAVGWHLMKKRIQFWHAHCINGTEMDFIAQTQSGLALIECKVLSVSTSPKQLARNVRESVKQLGEHAALLTREGWELRGVICVVNLTNADLASLRRSGFPIGSTANRLLSYEDFRTWLRKEIWSRNKQTLP